jgi:hypothetical protein
VASGAEVRGNDSVNLDEPLGMPSGLEPSHSPLPFTRRLMRVLGPVVQVAMLAMSNAGHHHSFRRPIAAQLISNNDARFAPSCPQKLAKKPNCGETIPLRLNENVQDDAVLIDRSPEIVSDAVDLEEDFVQMPFITGSSTPSSQAVSILLPNLSHQRRTVS